MGLFDVREVDYIGEDRSTGEVVLTIVDEVDWEDEYSHLITLQEKINNYLSFIESEEINNVYRVSISQKIIIDVAFKHEPTDNCLKFLNTVAGVTSEIGVGVTYSLYCLE